MRGSSSVFPRGVWSVVACVAVVATAQAYPEGPPTKVTGGFGEDTCVTCHDSYKLNAGRTEKLGDVVITGFPAAYTPGQAYPIKLEVTHVKDRSIWGFELATRFKDGTQAGQLTPGDANAQIMSEKGVDYIQHTADGTFSNSFSFTWTAPGVAMGDISVDAAANAANGDADSGGDYIYSTNLTVQAR